MLVLFFLLQHILFVSSLFYKKYFLQQMHW
jgi:hypothetical protein